jgi:alkanesulfonate monooxygenase SsuD/methylene tetrahydromethanopterin reductase-like flavin-dependent oxidoreductase (luciferase family)
MQYAVNLPIIGEYSNPGLLAELAYEAEQAGWAGVFVWDTLVLDTSLRPPITDPWIALAAIATRTERVKLGTMVAQLARRRPWKVAREVVALDQLSGGRLILGVGLGYAPQADFEPFGEEGDARVRARKLDEALEIITGLCTGAPFSYHGAYYQVAETVFTPRPVQPQIPIWVGGYWPNRKPFQRAARWDGVCPAEMDIRPERFAIRPTTPETVRTISAYIAQHRTKKTPFDVVISRTLPADPAQAEELIAAYAAAGVTWVYQDLLPWEIPFPQARALIRRGPLK